MTVNMGKRAQKKPTLSQAPSKVAHTPVSAGYHHGDLKRALIEEAVRFLETGSPENLSLRELAHRLGVSQAAPYRHFKDKEAVLAAISQEGFELKYRYMKEGVLKHRSSARDMLIACGESYFRLGLEHPQHFRLMMSGGCKPDETRPELMVTACRTFALLKWVIERCQKEGVLGPGDPYHRALHCWAIVNGFTNLYTDGRLEWLGVTPENSRSAFRT